MKHRVKMNVVTQKKGLFGTRNVVKESDLFRFRIWYHTSREMKRPIFKEVRPCTEL